MQSLCHDLLQWLDHYRRVERQLQAEADRVEHRKQQRIHTVRGQILELRRALDAKERTLVRQMEETCQQVRPPVAEAAGVRAKYARALAPLEQALQSFQTARGGTAALQFLRTGPSLMKEALHSFKVRDQREELKLKQAVKAVKSANAQAEAVLSSLQTNLIRQQIEQLGTGEAPPLLLEDVSREEPISVYSSRASSAARRSPPRPRQATGGQSLSWTDACSTCSEGTCG
ncbi:hypothetical protein ADEAN_000346300 [Angomonas deanei]|uniref:Uncharacterized protein n=1 Tax=Angomonas deanei TaxID=59799 RepID=A0A7G2C982_9TRYP|nr:hypothetical protein ADEAN_000346300 [Angomonas deanei]